MKHFNQGDLMKCIHCNSEIPQDSKFCPNCGYHFPDMERSKTSFSNKLLKMIFGEREAKIHSEAKTLEIEKPKKKKNWGIGWFFLIGLVSYSINNVYKNWGENIAILNILGVTFSLLIYFYFRNKVLNEISASTTRSFLSACISLFLTGLIIAGIAEFIKHDIISEVSGEITNESKIISLSLKSFTKDEALLSDLFIDEPSTRNEIMNNIKILDESIPLYNLKDSLAQTNFSSIYSILYNAEKMHPDEMKNYPMKSDFILSLRDSYNIFASNTYTKFITLKSYYNALLSGDENTEVLWDKVMKAQNNLENSQVNYMSLINKFQEVQKKLIELAN
jgi:hypothetical protein